MTFQNVWQCYSARSCQVRGPINVFFCFFTVLFPAIAPEAVKFVDLSQLLQAGCVYIFTHTYTCSSSICMCICVCVYTRVAPPLCYIHIRVCVYTHTRVAPPCICVHIYVYTYMCVHTRVAPPLCVIYTYVGGVHRHTCSSSMYIYIYASDWLVVTGRVPSHGGTVKHSLFRKDRTGDKV
jgi:hypothetical protein